MHDDDRAHRALALALLQSGLSRHAPASRRVFRLAGSLHESGPAVVCARMLRAALRRGIPAPPPHRALP